MNIKLNGLDYILLILTIFIYSSSLFPQEKLLIENRIDSLFKEYSGEIPGVAVAVVKDGEIIFKKGYGLANLEYNLAIESSTPFNIGSVSKQFTAYAAYLLEDDGEISLEDDIISYLPELPDIYEEVKIKHLLSHTSGIKDQWALLSLSGWRMDDIITNNHIMDLVKNQKELNFPSGSKFMYSNTGYTLVAKIIERVSGKKFSSFMKSRIFQPLKMNDSQFLDDYGKLIKNRAYSYEKVGDGYVKKIVNYRTAGATSLYTTVEDLAKWSSNFHEPIVGDSSLIKKFNKTSYLNDGNQVIWARTSDRTIYYAKGQLAYDYKGISVITVNL